MEEFWKTTFGALRCITLTSRSDRQEAAQKVFDQLSMPVQFLRVERDAQNGERGCMASHQLSMQMALDAKCETLLNLEDDLAVLNVPQKSEMDEVQKFVANADWDILFLGAYPNIVFESSDRVEGYKHIRRVHSQLTHAYAVSERFMKKFVKVDYECLYTPIDKLLMLSQKAFAVTPTWFYQTNSPSDISSAPRGTDLIRRSVVRFKNVYASSVNVPLIWIMLSALLICMILLFILCICK